MTNQTHTATPPLAADALPNPGLFWERHHQRRRGAELEFLPAALEVLESPAPPLPRILLLTICLLLLVAVIWSVIGRIDSVAVATGVVVPGGHVPHVQHPEGGVVAAIRVEEGQRVAAGEILVELDPVDSEVDQERVAATLADAQGTIAVITAIGTDPEGAVAAMPRLLAGASPTVRAQASALVEQLAALVQERQAVAQDSERLNAAREAAEQEERLAGDLLPVLTAQEAEVRALTGGDGDRPIVANATWRNAWKAKREAEGARDRARLRQREAAAELAAAAARGRRIDHDFKARLADAQREAETKAAESASLLRRAASRHGRTALRAPVAGTVHRLAVAAPGAVVKPAEDVCLVVPSAADLEIEALAMNRDIGQIHLDQVVRIKVACFPFTRFGLLTGRVRRIAADAIADEKLGPVFPVAISIDAIPSGTVFERIGPGLAVEAELVIGDRPVIDFLLSPLRRTVHEAFREP